MSKHYNCGCGDHHSIENDYCEAPLKVRALHQLAKLEYEYRSLDGSGNNKVNTDFGKKEKPFVRMAKARYNNDDGCSLNDLNGKRPNPRDVSNKIFDQPESIPDETCLSNIFWDWGQFVDHDITLTHGSGEPAPIIVTDPQDLLYPIIPFERSQSTPDAAHCGPENPREQINLLTPFIDASNVYGSSEDRNKYIRSFEDGKLRLVYGDLPPQNDMTMQEAGPGRGAHFVCGDIRANEQLGLTAMHSLFVREHNYWAHQLKCADSCLSDEEIYQRARIMVEAEIEAITYNEFIPKILGKNMFGQYNYDSSVNPQISNEFSVAAYRVGHSMIPTDILEGVMLRDAFFSSHFICNGKMTIGEILKQFSEGRAEKIDAKLIDDLRNFLFGRPGQGGLDLASLNLQRGRDHGLALINDLLEAYHLAPIHNWEQLTDDTELIAKLESLYEKPEDIDPWLYGLLENPDEGSKSIVGSMMTEIIKDSFLRLRNGDRLWYENRLTKDQIELVNKTRLSDIVRRNTGAEVDDDMFVVKKCVCGDKCNYHCGPRPPCYDDNNDDDNDDEKSGCSCEECRPKPPCGKPEKPERPERPEKPCDDYTCACDCDSSSSSSSSDCSKHRPPKHCPPKHRPPKHRPPKHRHPKRSSCDCHRCKPRQTVYRYYKNSHQKRSSKTKSKSKCHHHARPHPRKGACHPVYVKKHKC
jgi:peroxidase